MWEQGVNEKTFLAKPPYNKTVGWEYNCEQQTDNGSLFNIILKDGTRSDNAFTDYHGLVWQRYDYFLPQNKRITAVTIYYNYSI